MTKRLDMCKHAILCCAAVVLTACGGGELDVQEQPTQLAARTHEGATATGLAPVATAGDLAAEGSGAPPPQP